ncbi:MAG: hypothetical protein WA821_10085 [Anaerolineales bacterium]
MTDEKIEEVAAEEENEPIYYKPKMLSLIATVAMWVGWVVLVVFILVVVAQALYLNGIAAQGSMNLIDMMKDAQQGQQVQMYIYTNMVIPFFTGLSLFLLLQAAAIGLNALLEIDFNVREQK